MSADKSAVKTAAKDTVSVSRDRQSSGSSGSDILFYMILVVTLLLADVVLSIYYYRNQGEFDMRWILAALDVSLILSVMALAGKHVSHFLTSMKLALTMLFVIAILSIIGTWLPQGEAVLESGWVKNPLYDVYRTLGLFDVYHSRWFLAILYLLAFNLSFCIFKRLPTTYRHTLKPRVDVKDKFIVNQPFAAKFDGAGEKGMELARKTLSGMRYRIRSGQTGSVMAEKGRYAGLASIAFHLSFLLIGVGAMLGAVFGFDETVEIREGQTVDVRGTTLKATNYDFQIKYTEVMEDGRNTGSMPTEYSTDLEVFTDGQSMERKVVTVNGPLRVSTYNPVLTFLASLKVNFHQASYYQSDRGVVSVLQVNQGPGKSLIYLGFFLMMGGICFSLYFPHRRIWLKVGDSGELLAGGRTNRAKVTFQRDFERLTSELRVKMGQEDKTHG